MEKEKIVRNGKLWSKKRLSEMESYGERKDCQKWKGMPSSHRHCVSADRVSCIFRWGGMLRAVVSVSVLTEGQLYF